MGGWGFFAPIETREEATPTVSHSLPISSGLLEGSRSRSSTMVSGSPSSCLKKSFFENFFDTQDVAALKDQLSVSFSCAHDLCKAGFITAGHLQEGNDLLLSQVVAQHCDDEAVAEQECARLLSASKRVIKHLQDIQQLSYQESANTLSALNSEDSNQTSHEADSLPSPASQSSMKVDSPLTRGLPYHMMTSLFLSNQALTQDEGDAVSTVSGASTDSEYDGLDGSLHNNGTLDKPSDEEEMFFPFELDEEEEFRLKDGVPNQDPTHGSSCEADEADFALNHLDNSDPEDSCNHTHPFFV